MLVGKKTFKAKTFKHYSKLRASINRLDLSKFKESMKLSDDDVRLIKDIVGYKQSVSVDHVDWKGYDRRIAVKPKENK